MSLRERKTALFCLLLALVFFAYLWTLSPSVSVGDSGEYIAAARILGLPHAPSYPLFTLLGKAAMTLVPWANPAYRVNLLSLSFGAGSAALLGLLALEIGLSAPAALLAASSLGFSSVLWEPSLTAEVFSLNAFLAVLLLYVLCLDPRRHSLPKRISMAAFLLGLGMGNHHTLVLAAPSLALLSLRKNPNAEDPPRDRLQAALRCLPAALFFFLLGFSVYLYLPVRASKQPVLDWDHPVAWAQFKRVITRADYGSLSLTLGEKMPHNLANAARQVARYGSSLVQDISWVGLAVGLLGWVLWLRADAGLALPFLCLFLLAGPGFLILGNMPFDAQSNGVLGRFYILPAIPFFLALGYGFDRLARGRKALLLLAALPLYILLHAQGLRVFSRNDFAAYDYGRNLLKTLPSDSALFMDGGDDTFYTLAYLTLAENRRPDLVLHDRGGLIYPNPYGDDFRRIPKEEKEARRRLVERTFLGKRPLFYATFNRNVLPGARLVPRGLLYEAVPADGTPPASDPLWDLYAYRGVYRQNPDLPYRLRALLPVYPYLQGLESWDEARLRRAAAFGLDIAWLASNLDWETATHAYDLTQRRQIEAARRTYRMELEFNPKSAAAYCNLGVLFEHENDLAAAEAQYRKALEADPAYAQAHYNLGVLYWKQERWPDVASEFERTLQLDTNHPSAGRYLMEARQKLELGR